MSSRILVTGAGGFIPHHLVARLKREGHWVRGVDIKWPEYEPSPADEFEILDLRQWEACARATEGVDLVYSLAAAICRKVALASDGGEIDIWGDGEQTRSFMYIDDCVEGLLRLMASDCRDPLNLGTDEMVTINELVDIACEVAGKELRKRYDLTKPQGVRGRNSVHAPLRPLLRW